MNIKRSKIMYIKALLVTIIVTILTVASFGNSNPTGFSRLGASFVISNETGHAMTATLSGFSSPETLIPPRSTVGISKSFATLGGQGGEQQMAVELYQNGHR